MSDLPNTNRGYSDDSGESSSRTQVFQSYNTLPLLKDLKDQRSGNTNRTDWMHGASGTLEIFLSCSYWDADVETLDDIARASGV